MESSKRGYLTLEELEEFADITISDNDEAYDQIGHAEELIDDYLGFVTKFMTVEHVGVVSEVPSSTTFTLDADYINSFPFVDYFKWCHVEIIGGTGAGQQRKITASDESGVLTVESEFSTTIDTTSAYKIYQMAKFPRYQDVFVDSRTQPTKYYKSIPEAIKRAVAAQVEYRINMGDKFFAQSGQETSERIGDYSYTSKSEGGIKHLIAPKARKLLAGYIVRTGKIIV